jgi:hypothetical protein
MLDNLSGDMDTATNKINVVQAQLGKLLQTKDGCQIWTVVILALILIILGKEFANISFIYGVLMSAWRGFLQYVLLFGRKDGPF